MCGNASATLQLDEEETLTLLSSDNGGTILDDRKNALSVVYKCSCLNATHEISISFGNNTGWLLLLSNFV